MNSAIETPANEAQCFAALTTRFHRQLALLLQMHQEALLLPDLALALNAFDLFAEALHKHLQVEGGVLLPLHRTLIDTGRWPLLVYEKEHDKLLQMVERARREVLGLSSVSGRQRRLMTLDVLDYQGTLKSVMEHHEEREEQAFLPELDAHADSEIYRQAYAQVCLVWERYLADIEPRCRAIDDALNATSRN